MVAVQVGATPTQSPVQLTKCWPAAAVAVRVITGPSVNLAEQFLPQSMDDQTRPRNAFTKYLPANCVLSLFQALLLRNHPSAFDAEAMGEEGEAIGLVVADQ